MVARKYGSIIGNPSIYTIFDNMPGKVIKILIGDSFYDSELYHEGEKLISLLSPGYKICAAARRCDSNDNLIREITI